MSPTNLVDHEIIIEPQKDMLETKIFFQKMKTVFEGEIGRMIFFVPLLASFTVFIFYFYSFLEEECIFRPQVVENQFL